MEPIIVGITGATGAIIGVRLLESLKALKVDVVLVISSWAEETIREETSYSLKKINSLVMESFREDDLSAVISSGSFKTRGMVIAPCSMKTLASVASGFSNNLISRCADVTIKEQRKLILLTRETPLSAIHLENMLKLSRIGVEILPPCISFYNKPKTIDDVINQIVGKTLDLLNINNDIYKRWTNTKRYNV